MPAVTAETRSRAITLGVLLVILAVVAAWQFWPAPTGAAATPVARPVAGTKPAPAAPPDPHALQVHLDALQAVRTRPEPAGRDPFAFRPPPPPPPPPPVPGRPGGRDHDAGVTGPSEPPPPPPAPPITLKFIGLIVEGPKAGKIAVLSDGRFVFHGREGDIIEGRYRVVRIGDESVQMEHVDGRGRQTIRLSGS